MDKPQLWPIFICYRQVDGLATARRIHEMLHAQKIAGPDGKPIELDVYLDRAVPGVADWTKVHRPYLEKARALIVICTPGSRLEEGSGDHVHKEITWWIANRDSAPILVDPLEQGTRFIPRQIFNRWPDIQRVSVVEDEWRGLPEAQLREKRETVRNLIVGAILPSGAQIYAQELEDERRRARRLRVALGVSLVLLLAVLIAGGFALYSRRIAEASRLDSIAASLFTQSRLDDIRVNEEVANMTDLLRRLQESEEGSTRRINLEHELERVENDLGTLRGARSESISHGLDMLEAADQAWLGLPVADRNRPAPPYVFSIELLNAGSGESILIHYGLPDRPRIAMINAGPRAAYRELVEARLREIADNRFGGTVPISLFVAGDRDEEKTGGLLRMLEDIAEARPDELPAAGTRALPAGEQLVDLHRVWANLFAARGGASSARSEVRRLIDDLGIPLNEPFDHYVMRPDDGRVTVALTELQITVLGPTGDQIQELHRFAAREAEGRDATIDPLMTESFSRIVPPEEPLALEHDAVAVASTDCKTSDNARRLAGGSYTDDSPSNLASTVLLIQYRNKSFLFTGDSRGDHILAGLSSAGLLDSNGSIDVDLMSIPHLGSDRNVTVDFFSRVRASNYLFSGDGRHGNPEIPTIAALISARGCDSYRMYFANRDGSDDEHGKRLDAFFAAERASNPNYRRIFRSMEQGSVIIDLLEPLNR